MDPFVTNDNLRYRNNFTCWQIVRRWLSHNERRTYDRSSDGQI